MTRLLRIAAVAVLVGGATAVLSSCTGDPGPIVTQTPSLTATAEPVTPSPSPTPSATPEEELLAMIPENARGEDFQSATNFAKFYILEYQRMFDERDSELFAFLAADECGFCENGLETFASVIGAGGSTRGGGIAFHDELAAGGLEESGDWNVSFDISVGALEYVDASGTVTKSIDANTGRVGVLLRYEDSHWTVVEVASAAD